MIELRRVSLKQGSFQLKDIDLSVPAGKYAVLMGRSGTGKTTLIEAICGLRPLTAGQVIIDGIDVTAHPPATRGIGYVPQDGAVFSTMRVKDQLGFGLSIRRYKADEIRRRVEELADVLGIGHLLDRMPAGLSGGERQRVAIGRALAFRPAVLVFDEPTSALDDETRDEILKVIRTVHHQSGATVLHISHSAYESNALADFVFRINKGCITTSGSEDSLDRKGPPTKESYED